MRIERVSAAAYKVPTATPEEDGTFDWDATTAVIVHVEAGGEVGAGWTYSGTAAVTVITDLLCDVLIGRDHREITALWEDMRRACRNVGIAGLVMQAISAVDIALWDLAGRCLGAPVHELLGDAGRPVDIYGSGGFTNLTPAQLTEQVDAWKAAGCRAMKIKIGRDDDRDLERINQVHRRAPGAALMVDANGAYTRGHARRMGHLLDELGVTWFEEPVSSDDVKGLALLRSALRCDVAAGEYVSDAYGAAALVGAVDCLQLDGTRCGGYTGFRAAAAVAGAHGLDVSAHCSPALHASLAAVGNLRNIEWFVDHARLEPMLWVGVPAAADGRVAPNAAPGHGLRLRPEAEEYRL
ncbi:MAG: enolase C-terminal domain-like protein [Jatrophihabitans sp.]|uniref:enolase C-terminal domain-like protein n=1 Tax=Jatrophihabitans sp. TaxID=1932789 RepID=UPI003F7FDB37